MVLKISRQEAKKLGITKTSATSSKKENPETKRKDARHVMQADIACDTETIDLIIPLQSRPKERPRTFLVEKEIAHAFRMASGDIKKFMALLKVKTITPQETRKFENDLATAAKIMMGNKKRFDVPVSMTITIFLDGNEDEWPTAIGDGDLDNHEKSILDALNGIVYDDDKLVVQKTSQKRCSKTPRIEIKVERAKKT